MKTHLKSGIVKPKHLFPFHTQLISLIPSNNKAALRDQNWNNAMKIEFNALLKQDAWDLAPRPTDTNIIHCHWIFRHKFHANGTLERYKA